MQLLQQASRCHGHSQAPQLHSQAAHCRDAPMHQAYLPSHITGSESCIHVPAGSWDQASGSLCRGLFSKRPVGQVDLFDQRPFKWLGVTERKAKLLDPWDILGMMSTGHNHPATSVWTSTKLLRHNRPSSSRSRCGSWWRNCTTIKPGWLSC